MGSGYGKMKKQARLFQEQMAKIQEDMQNLEVKGSAGNGLVEVILSGEKEMKNIQIRPECVDPEDVEGLQDLILAAFMDASKKIEEKSPLPNMNGLGLEHLTLG